VSKKLTPRRREIADEWICKNAKMHGVGEVSASIVNRVGMAKATNMAFRKAVADANLRAKRRIEYLLIDAFYVPYIRGIPIRRKTARKDHKLRDRNARQRAIVNGDEKVISIAAASIVAKVYRDSLMKKIGKRERYKKYDWVNNKGYASKKHQNAILKYGITGYHRKQFVDTFLKNKGLKLQ
jgi:ribonuclease HII